MALSARTVSWAIPVQVRTTAPEDASSWSARTGAPTSVAARMAIETTRAAWARRVMAASFLERRTNETRMVRPPGAPPHGWNHPFFGNRTARCDLGVTGRVPPVGAREDLLRRQGGRLGLRELARPGHARGG